MWVQNKVSSDHEIFGPRSGLYRFWNRCRPWIDRLPLGLCRAFGDYLVSLGWLPRFDSHPIKFFSPDVIHLHWVQGGFIPIDLVEKWRGLPLFWTFHDEWPFSGLRHYGSGNDQASNGILRKWDRRMRSRKSEIYKKVTPIGIAPSHWIRGRAEASEVWEDCRTQVLPNPIDSSTFLPGEKGAAREQLGLPQDLPLVLFGAEAGASDPRKGFDLLREACGILSKEGVRFGLVCFGNGSQEEVGGVPCYSLGWLGKDEDLATAYSAADLVALPSRMDNLPNTGVEAISCGRPVVSFAVGGIPEIVEDGVSGFLCEAEDPVQLAEKIGFLLEGVVLRSSMEVTARQKAVEQFSSQVLVPKFIKLYQGTLDH